MRDEILRWKAVATYRKTHDEKLVLTNFFEEIADIDPWIEGNPDWQALESLVVTYNLNDQNLTLAEIDGEDSKNEETADGAEVH